MNRSRLISFVLCTIAIGIAAQNSSDFRLTILPNSIELLVDHEKTIVLEIRYVHYVLSYLSFLVIILS